MTDAGMHHDAEAAPEDAPDDASGALVLEIGAPPAGGCPCCDPVAAQPQGYILSGDQPLALYFSDGALPGPVPAALVTVSVGRWDAASGPGHRTAVCLRLERDRVGELGILPVSPELSRWKVLGMIGSLLDEQTFEDHPARAGLLHVAETIAVRDPMIIAALAPRDADAYRLAPRPSKAPATPFSAAPGAADD